MIFINHEMTTNMIHKNHVRAKRLTASWRILKFLMIVFSNNDKI